MTIRLKQPFFSLALGLLFMHTLAAADLSPTLLTATATIKELPREFRLDGTVEAINQSTISAQTSGQVEEILFDVDNFVKKGTLIIRLKDTEQQAVLARATADSKAATAQLQEAKDTHKRTKGLYGKKLVAQAAMDKTNAALKTARAHFDSAKAALSQAKEQIQYTQIKAPYSGIVTQRHVELGEVAQPGQALMTGISLDKLRVTVDVPQTLIPSIRKLMTALVYTPEGEAIKATNITIFPYADHASNTFKVRLDLPDNIGSLFPGMFVKTAFQTSTRKELVIPAQTVVFRSEVTAVYVIANGKESMRHIRLGHRTSSGEISVLAGLNPGEKIALDPIAAGVSLKARITPQKSH